MEKPTNNNGKLVGALLVGAAVGGALGILFAPDKGSVTRRKIANKSGDISDSIKDTFNDFTGMAKREVDSLKSKSHNVADHAPIKA